MYALDEMVLALRQGLHIVSHLLSKLKLLTWHMALFWLEGNKLLQMKNKIITLVITLFFFFSKRALLFKIMTIKSFIYKYFS